MSIYLNPVELNDSGRIYSRSRRNKVERQQERIKVKSKSVGLTLSNSGVKLNVGIADSDTNKVACNKCISSIKDTLVCQTIREESSEQHCCTANTTSLPTDTCHCLQAASKITNCHNGYDGLQMVLKDSTPLTSECFNICSTGSCYCSSCSIVRPFIYDISSSSGSNSTNLSEDFHHKSGKEPQMVKGALLEETSSDVPELNQQFAATKVGSNLQLGKQHKQMEPCVDNDKSIQQPGNNIGINQFNQVNELPYTFPLQSRLKISGKLDTALEEELLTDEKLKEFLNGNKLNSSNQNQEINSGNLEEKQVDTTGNKSSSSSSSSNNNKWDDMCWENVARRYDEMPIQHRGRFWSNTRQSCLCQLFCSTIPNLFPILTSFRDYSLPNDLFTDLMAGFTIAVLHIPQGMAYGMLAGVEPIYGLYVSFIPVLVMAFMSNSKHVSYGTFAVISVLLSQAVESAKQAIRQKQYLPTNSIRQSINSGSDSFLASASHEETERVLINNHKPTTTSTAIPQQVLKNLILPIQTTSQPLLNFDSSLESVGSSYESQVDFNMPTNMEILTSICILVGIIQITMSIMRLGVLSLMFSDQLVSSFTTGSAIHVVTSQLGGLFDISMPPATDGLFKICRIWYTFVEKLLEGFNQYTAILSALSILFLLVIKDLFEPMLRKRFKSLTCLPAELILMASLIFSSWYWQFTTIYDIKIIGDVPTELPSPSMPRLDLVSFVIPDAITVALVCFAMNLSLAQVYAKKFKYTLDPNHELFALGAANVVGSFFSCYPCASSLSRSAVQSRLNVKSQLSSLFSCALVVLIICYFAPILHDLPRSTLSCIILVALKGILVQISDLYENWRLSKLDALVWIITFVAVILVGVTYGLVLGIIASLFMVFFRLLTPNHSILGNISGTEIFVDKEAFADAKEVERVRIFRFNSPLCYLNRTMFKSCIEEVLPSVYRQETRLLIGSNKRITELENNKVRFLIIDCSALAYCDYSGAATLIDIVEELATHKIQVFLATCPLKLISMIEKMKKPSILKQVCPSITDAVNQVRLLTSRSTRD